MSSNTNIGNTPVNQGYVQLIHMGETGGIDGTLRALYDGDGTGSDLLIASNKVKIATELFIGSKTLSLFIQDTVGAMFDGNTETNISATYQTADNTIDLVSSGDVTATNTITFTNKTINADNNTLSNIEVDNFKSGVLDTNISSVAGTDTTLASAKAIKAYVDTEVAGIVNSAPSTLDTLDELAAALGDDANYAATTTAAIGLRALKSNNLSDLANASTARSNLGIVSGHLATAPVSNGATTLATGDQIYDFVTGLGYLTSVPNHSANLLTSGTVPLARLSNISDSQIASDASIAASKIVDLATSKITSGTFADARIPNLSTSKITSGTLADARIAASNVTQHGDGRYFRTDATSGTITSQDWNTYIDGLEVSFNQVNNHSGSNRPSGAYGYGLALSYATGSSYAKFQLYAPEKASAGDATNQGLWYRTGWSSTYRQWAQIWDSTNDGSGSGLDADLLDGQHASAFLTSVPNHSANLLTSGTVPLARISGLTTDNIAADAVIEASKLGDIPASKITSGTLADARIAESNVTQHTDSKYLRSNADDTASGDLTLTGVVNNTNNANVDGPNFNVSTTNKTTGEYAYRVDRSGSVVGGILIDGKGAFASGSTVGGSAILTSVPNHSANLLTSGTIPVARISDISDSNIAIDALISGSKIEDTFVKNNTSDTISHVQNAESLLTLHNNRQDASNVPIFGIAGKQSCTIVGKMSFYRGGGGNSGYMTFSTKVDNDTALSEKMRLDGAGRLGIGVTDPWSSTKLDLGTSGSMRTGERLYFYDSNRYIQRNGNDIDYYSNSGEHNFTGNVDTTGSFKMDNTDVMDTNKRLVNLTAAVGTDRSGGTHIVDFATPDTPGSTGWYTICKADSVNARGGGVINISVTGGSMTPTALTIDFMFDWSGVMTATTKGHSGQLTKIRAIETGSTTELQIYVNTTVAQALYVSFERDRYNPNFSLLSTWATASPSSTQDEILLNGFAIGLPTSGMSVTIPRGYLGVNTNTPAHTLDVSGNIRNFWYGSAIARVESTAGGYGAYSRLTTTTNSYDLVSLNGDFLIDESGVATRFIIKDSTGNIGIGTSEPGNKLEVRGDIAVAISDTQDIIKLSDAGNDGSIELYTGESTPVLRTKLTAHGNSYFGNSNAKLGIGTSSPETLMHIKAADTVTGVLKIEGGKNTVTSNGEVNARLEFGSNDGSVSSAGQVGASIATHTSNANGAWNDLVFSTFKQNDPGLREVMRLDYLGRLAIGTASPAASLDVKSQINVTNANNDSLVGLKGTRFGYSTSYKVVQIGNTSGNESVSIGYDPSGNSSGSFTGDGREVIFRNGVEFTTPNSANNGFHNDILVLKDGNVGIGEASPTTELHLGTCPDARAITFDQSGRFNGIGNYFSSNATDSRIDFFLSDGGTNGDTNQEFAMYASGNFHADADVVAYSSSVGSDRKLKKNIKDTPYGLDDVLKMRAVEFDWKEKRNGVHDIGVIAQEIEKIIPEVVQEVETLKTDGDTHKVVDYGKLTSVLIKAIQEQQDQIDDLKTKLGE